MITHRHILGTFDEALGALRNNVLMMAGLAERSLERAMKGLIERDDDICANAIADDEEIDQLEKQVDKEFLEIDAAGRQSIAINALIDESKAVTTYIRYESRMVRIYDRAFTRLQQLKNSQNDPSR